MTNRPHRPRAPRKSLMCIRTINAERNFYDIGHYDPKGAWHPAPKIEGYRRTGGFWSVEIEGYPKDIALNYLRWLNGGMTPGFDVT